MGIVAVQAINLVTLVLWVALFAWGLRQVQTISTTGLDLFLCVLLMLILPVLGAVIVLVLAAKKGTGKQGNGVPRHS